MGFESIALTTRAKSQRSHLQTQIMADKHQKKVCMQHMPTSSICGRPLAGRAKSVPAANEVGRAIPRPPGSGSPTPPNLTATPNAQFPCTARARCRHLRFKKVACPCICQNNIELAPGQNPQHRESDKQANQQACDIISLPRACVFSRLKNLMFSYPGS